MSELQVFPWHDPLWAKLNLQIQSDRLPHALLFTGPRGVGKGRFALRFAHYLLCHQPQDGHPCGHCRSCELLKSGHHPDLLIVEPDESGKAIRVDQVRDLSTALHSTAQQGGYRLVIMKPAEAMNVAAANALLKTLEEPGDKTLLILVTHQLGQLMPTIRSRCQRVDFVLPDTEQASGWLATELSMQRQDSDKLLSIAQGAPLSAVAMQSDGRLELRRDFMQALADLLRGREDPLKIAEKLHKEDVESLLEWLISILNDIVKIQSNAQAQCISNVDMTKMMTAVANRNDATRVFALCDLVQEERLGLMLRQNPNRQLLLEKLLLDWCALMR